MDVELNIVRYLGFAQLVVFTASMLSERLLTTAVGSGNISDKLINISNNLTRIRISNLVAMINCCAIVALGALFYIVCYQQYKLISFLRHK